MRKLIIAGNWKMNKTRDEALKFIYDVNNDLPSKSVIDTVIFPQSVHIRCLVKRQGDNLLIGAQNFYYEEKGAYTGEVSPLALKDIGCSYVLIGHSERRDIFGETDELINKKLHTAISHGLNPIVCVGENLEQRQNDETTKIVSDQIKKAFKDVLVEDAKDVVIAYEPIWAIGTGVTATKEQADETCGVIRDVIKEIYSLETAKAIRIQYGGSVNPSNFKELINMPNIDGALIGGASLESAQFLDMINQIEL